MWDSATTRWKGTFDSSFGRHKPNFLQAQLPKPLLAAPDLSPLPPVLISPAQPVCFGEETLDCAPHYQPSSRMIIVSLLAPSPAPAEPAAACTFSTCQAACEAQQQPPTRDTCWTGKQVRGDGSGVGRKKSQEAPVRMN